MPVLNNGKPEKHIELINLQLIFINIRIDSSFFLKRLREGSLMSSLISFQTLAPYGTLC